MAAAQAVEEDFGLDGELRVPGPGAGLGGGDEGCEGPVIAIELTGINLVRLLNSSNGGH